MQGIKEANEMYTTGPLPPGSFSGQMGKRQKEGSPRRLRRERATGTERPRRTDRIG